MSLAAVWQHRWKIGLAACMAVGAAFRLIWVSDMEYKSDEAWTFTHVEQFWSTYRLEPVGMFSSTGMPNAGMSLWIFVAISSLLGTFNPLILARAVQLTNVAAICLLAAFVQKSVDPAEREPWLWSIALVSASPLAVIFSRKIWPQDILPIFTATMLIGWWHRGRWWGAFLWGLIGALLGQIHLSGFFFAAGFFACTLAFARHRVHWRAWLGGSVLGTAPSLPWLLIVAQSHYQAGSADLHNLAKPFLWFWLKMALGIDLHYSLGNDFWPFLAYPRLGGYSTYLSAACLAAICFIFLIIFGRLGRCFLIKPFQTLQLLFGPRSPTVLTLDAACWVCGLFLTLTLRPFYLHYFVVAFSLPNLWLAWLVRVGQSSSERAASHSRLLLSAMVLALAGTSLLFLAYVHETQFIRGDYGTAYRSQSRH